MHPDGSPIRVMLLEDDRGTRETLATLLRDAPGFLCVGEEETVAAALREIPRQKPHVVLVDLQLPGASGVEFLRACRRRFSEVELLVLTVHGEATWVFPALEAGASGYLLKGTAGPKILEAIREIHAGGSSMSSQVARLVLKSFRRVNASSVVVQPLTPREVEVLEALARGLRYVDIADHLGISPRTVNTHLYRIYEKLHVHSAAGAVGKLLEAGELPPSKAAVLANSIVSSPIRSA